ncbi:hypothetical protein BG011_009959 [Mortierella polycephala]|uniref:Uncharacterized protein n=1 Tax=Mortierella polycephala TaxID=41804 RepID=A0A9P6QC47_9FUNG|nr:hypothetical protein BG011_009959 [Mortierella polycephala]
MANAAEQLYLEQQQQYGNAHELFIAGMTATPMQDSASYPESRIQGPHGSQQRFPSPSAYCLSTSDHHHSASPSFDRSSLSCEQCSTICHDDALEDIVDVLDTNGTSVVSSHACLPLLATLTPFDDSVRPAVAQRTASTASVTTVGFTDQELEEEDFMIHAYRIHALKASSPSSRQPSQNQQGHRSGGTTGIMVSMAAAAATTPTVNNDSLTTAFSSPTGPLDTVSSSDSASSRRLDGYVEVVDAFNRGHLPYIGYYTNIHEAGRYEALYAINYGEQDNPNADGDDAHEQELLISSVLNQDEGAGRQSMQGVNSISRVGQHQGHYLPQWSTNSHGMSRVISSPTPLPTHQNQTNDTIAHQIRHVHASHIMELHRQWEQQRERQRQEMTPEQRQQQLNHAPNPYPGSVPMSRYPPPPLLPPHIQRRFQDIPPVLQPSSHGLSSASSETIHSTESVASPHRASFQSSVYPLVHDETPAPGAASLANVPFSSPLPASMAAPPRSPPSTEDVELQNEACSRVRSTGSNSLYTDYEGGTLRPGEQWRRGDREMVGR